MSTVHEITTAEQLLEARGLGRCELVQGELVTMSPAGFEHGVIAVRIGACLHQFVQQHRLGLVTAAETGFWIGHNPDTVRASDVGFVCAARVPHGRIRGFFQGPPDLAVEVMSPDDCPGEVLSKVQNWLAAGCHVVWVVDPNSRTIAIYHGSEEPEILTVDDDLAADDILPGFRLSVAEIF